MRITLLLILLTMLISVRGWSQSETAVDPFHQRSNLIGINVNPLAVYSTWGYPTYLNTGIYFQHRMKERNSHRDVLSFHLDFAMTDPEWRDDMYYTNTLVQDPDGIHFVRQYYVWDNQTYSFRAYWLREWDVRRTQIVGGVGIQGGVWWTNERNLRTYKVVDYMECDNCLVDSPFRGTEGYEMEALTLFGGLDAMVAWRFPIWNRLGGELSVSAMLSYQKDIYEEWAAYKADPWLIDPQVYFMLRPLEMRLFWLFGKDRKLG